MSTENMKSVITPIAGLYDIKYNTLGELKRAVDSAYNELGDVETRGVYRLFESSVTYRESTPEEIEGERRAALRTIEYARKQWEATAKVYGWNYE